MVARILLICALSLVIVNAPAAASDGVQVPEASSFTLFALGLAGILIGRLIASKKQ